MTDPTRVVIPWVLPEPEKTENIEWREGATNYKVNLPILMRDEIAYMLPHCVEVRDKIDRVVRTQNHKGPSMFIALERSLGNIFRPVWRQCVADFAGGENTVESFDDTLRAFLAIHCDEEDRDELVAQVRGDGSLRKPRELRVQQFWYQMRLYNSYVAWLPGTAAALTDEQLKVGFFAMMPIKWRERWNEQGKYLRNETVAQTTRWFRKQEDNAIRSMERNRRDQQAKAASKPKGNGKGGGSYKGSPRGKTAETKTPATGKRDGTQSTRISDDTPCPVHPGAGHTHNIHLLSLLMQGHRPASD